MRLQTFCRTCPYRTAGSQSRLAMTRLLLWTPYRTNLLLAVWIRRAACELHDGRKRPGDRYPLSISNNCEVSVSDWVSFVLLVGRCRVVTKRSKFNPATVNRFARWSKTEFVDSGWQELLGWSTQLHSHGLEGKNDGAFHYR